MLSHQIKVAQALASSVAQGGRGMVGTPFRISLKNQSSSMNLKVHLFVVECVKC
jgi:hypothetical protein